MKVGDIVRVLVSCNYCPMDGECDDDDCCYTVRHYGKTAEILRVHPTDETAEFFDADVRILGTNTTLTEIATEQLAVIPPLQQLAECGE